MRLSLFFIFALLILSSAAHARVFDFNAQTFATYLRGTYGFTNLQTTAFQPGFPTTVSFNGTNVNQDFSGEFGFSYSTPKAFTFRLGVELLYPQNVTGEQGTNSAGTLLMGVDSQVYSVIPQVNFEFLMKKTPTSRWYVGLGGGYAVTTLKNTVTMTSAGTTALGLSNYIEEGTGYGIMGQASTGYEFNFFDNVGFSLDLGYRYLIVNNYTANRDYKNSQGQVYAGNAVKNFDGTNRATDLSGFFAGATFRIYIQ